MDTAVTGATGFIGRRLVDELLSRRQPVRVLIHRSSLGIPGKEIQGDICRKETLPPLLEGADTLFHLASVLGNQQLPDGDYWAVNRDGVNNLLEAAVQCGVKRVIHFSSAGVYGRSSGIVPLKEDGRLNPRDIYETSKLAGEHAAFSFTDRLSVTIVRPGWIYGEGDRRTFKLIRQIGRGIFFIPGKGKVCQSVLHVDDLVRLVLRLAEKGENGQIYNAGGENLSVEEISAEIAAALGKSSRFLKLPMALVAPAAWMMDRFYSLLGREAPLTMAKLAFFLRGKPLDMSKTESQIGFRPAVTFSEGIRYTVDWYKTNGWF